MKIKSDDNILVSIVTLNYNGKQFLEKLLDSCLNLNKKFGDMNYEYEIIFIDNGSSDGSVDFVKKNYNTIKIIELSKNEGYPAMNKGFHHAKGDYVLIINNDMELTSDCVHRLLMEMEDKDVMIASPKLINYFDRKKIDSYGNWLSRSFYAGYIKDFREDVKKNIPFTGLGLFKKEIVSEVGYVFDPEYFLYAEDVDLGIRLALRGKRIVYVPDAIMYHMESATAKKTFQSHKTIFFTERNLLTTFFKNLEFKNIILLSPYVFGMRFIAIVRDLLNLRFRNSVARIKAILWIFYNFRSITGRREKIQSKRRVSDKVILKNFSEKYLFQFK